MTAPLQVDEQTVRSIVEDVMRGLGRTPAAPTAPPRPAAKPTVNGAAASLRSASGRWGVFSDVPAACAAAQAAFEQLRAHGLAGRAKVVEIALAKQKLGPLPHRSGVRQS